MKRIKKKIIETISSIRLNIIRYIYQFHQKSNKYTNVLVIIDRLSKNMILEGLKDLDIEIVV